MRPLCATIYNCSDPEDCWLEDIGTGSFSPTENGVKGVGDNKHSMIYWVRAVSVMPGCKFKGEQSKDTGHLTDILGLVLLNAMSIR